MKQMVYLIGGGPGAGKSSIARGLSRKYGFALLRGDDLEGAHRKQAADDHFPVNSYLNSLSPSDRQLELIRFSAQQEQARQEELFYMLLKDLRGRKFKDLIIEGNFIIPDLVRERFELPYKAVWLLPTLKFQSQIYLTRDWAIDLIEKTDEPTLTLHNWVKRDHKFIDNIKKQVQAANLPYLVINGSQEISKTQHWVEEQLGLGSKQKTA